MRTTVYGSWHLASVYAVGLASLGHEVRLLTHSPVRERYEAGEPPVFEPGLKEAIARLQSERKLIFTSDIPADGDDVCFFAEDCKVTESGVDLAAFRELFDPVAASGRFGTIAVSSQLPLGTCRELAAAHPALRIVYFPEFLRLGTALDRFLRPDFIVVGGEHTAAAAVLDFFAAQEAPKFTVTLEEAEMTKHAANAFVATSVSFVSELTKFSERWNVNLERIGAILRCDKRIGPKAYVMPGMGFSGETVERDIRVLIGLAAKSGFDLPMFREVIAVNNEHNRFIERELARRFPDMNGKKVGFLGATYRPSTSTLRGSLFAPLMERLAADGALVVGTTSDSILSKSAALAFDVLRSMGAPGVVLWDAVNARS